MWVEPGVLRRSEPAVDEVPIALFADTLILPHRCRMSWRIFKHAIVLLCLAALTLQALAQAQRVETQGAQSPAIWAGGNVALTYGLTPEQAEELTKAAAAG